MNTLLRLTLSGLLVFLGLHTLSCSGQASGLGIFERGAFTKSGKKIEAIIKPFSTGVEIIAALEQYAAKPCRVEFQAEWKDRGTESNERSSLMGTALVVDEATFAFQHPQPIDDLPGSDLLIEDVVFNGEIWTIISPLRIERTIQSQVWESNGFPPQGGLLLAPTLGIHPLSQVVNLANWGNVEVKRNDDEIVLRIGEIEHHIEDAPQLLHYLIAFSPKTGHPIWSEWERVDGRVVKVDIRSFSFLSDLTIDSLRVAIEAEEAK